MTTLGPTADSPLLPKELMKRTTNEDLSSRGEVSSQTGRRHHAMPMASGSCLASGIFAPSLNHGDTHAPDFLSWLHVRVWKLAFVMHSPKVQAFVDMLYGKLNSLADVEE